MPTGLGALANLRWLEVTVLTRHKGMHILAQPNRLTRASHGRIRRFGYRLRTACNMITRQTDAGSLAIEHPDIPIQVSHEIIYSSVYAMPRREQEVSTIL